MEESKRIFQDTGAPVRTTLCDYHNEDWAKSVHNHPYVEIAVIVNGVGVHKINGNERTIKKGDVCIINTESLHLFSPIDKENSQNLSILFIDLYAECLYEIGLQSTLLKDIVNMLSFKLYYSKADANSFCLTEEQLKTVTELFNKMSAEMTLDRQGRGDMLKLYLCIMLIEFLRCYSEADPSRPKTDSSHFALVKSVIDYLSGHYSEDISLNSIAELHHLSKRHLSRVFKEATGLSVFEYLQKIRMEKACFLLETTDLKINELTHLVGFSDYRHFGKIFKSYTGTTPKKYAKESR